MLHSPLELPLRGAGVLQPAGVSGVAILANTLGPEVKFRWPLRVMLRSMLLTERSGDPLVLAGLAISIRDENQKLLTTDGQGQAAFTNPTAFQGRGVPFLQTAWNLGRPFALQRLVQAGDIWTFQIANQNAATDTVPELTFFLASVKP